MTEEASKEEREGYPGKEDDWWYKEISNALSSRESQVNAETAQRVAAVHACVTVISESIAMIPVMVFEQLDEVTKTKASSHFLWNLFRKRPNRFMDVFRFFEVNQRTLLYSGNAYNFKKRNSLGEITELIPLRSDRMRVEIEDSKTRDVQRIVYLYTTPDKKQRRYSQDQIFHIANFTDDGILGKSPIEVVRDAVAFGS